MTVLDISRDAMSEPTHPDILTRLMRFCASPDIFVREEISGGYVRDMLRDARDEIDRLRAAIRRLADQDATLSVCEGNVTVEMDATLNDAERTLICRLAAACEGGHPREWTNRALTADDRATLRGLLERTRRMGGCLAHSGGPYTAGDQPPVGYCAWMEWAEVQHKAGLRQRQCVKCGQYRYPQEIASGGRSPVCSVCVNGQTL